MNRTRTTADARNNIASSDSAESIDTEAITHTINRLLAARAAQASICPSEVARALAPTDWRPLMAAVRAAAVQMARAGTLRITQGGVTLAPDDVAGGHTRGPIRLRRAERP